MAGLVASGLFFSSLVYAENAILVRADDTSEILQSTNIATKKNTPQLNNEIRGFLQQNRINSLEDYTAWLKENMRYQQGKFESPWESWQATIKRGFGDCKNLSVLSSNVLKYFGYKPLILGYKNAEGGHMFTAFYKDGTLSIFDNTDYTATQLKDFNEMGAYLYRKYDVDNLFEIDIESKTTRLIATRATLALSTR